MTEVIGLVVALAVACTLALRQRGHAPEERERPVQQARPKRTRTRGENRAGSQPVRIPPRVLVVSEHEVAADHVLGLEELPPLCVERETLIVDGTNPYWVQRGWQRTARGYSGSFRAGDRSWRGEILCRRGSVDCFIFEPPRRIAEHICFIEKGNGRFFVHFHRKPRSVCEGIHNVELEVARILGVSAASPVAT